MTDQSPAQPEIDWLLLGRYALLVGLCALIPIPIVDGWVENYLRRRLTRKIAARHGRELPPADLAVLSDAVGGGCLGMLLSIVLWPIKKVLKTLSIVFQVKGITDTFSEVVHRGLLLEDAFEAAFLPGDPARVRHAMDQALRHVDTRPIERTLLGALRDARADLNKTIWETVRVLRLRNGSRAAGSPRGGLLRGVAKLADAADADQLGANLTNTSRAMVAALQTRILVPELLAWFQAEMGQKVLEERLPGPIVPEVLDPPDEAPARALPAPIEDAEELPSPVPVGGPKATTG